MKKILYVLIHTFLFANIADPALLTYQKKYSLCKEKTNYTITKCLLNGNLNYARFRGDKPAYKKVSLSAIQEAEANANVYNYSMSLMPQSERYVGLKEYLDYLYSVREEYTPPKFKGNDSEDIIKTKRVFNLLQNAALTEDGNYTLEFTEALLQYQKSHGLDVDGEIGPQTKRALKEPIYSIILKIKKNLQLERISAKKDSHHILINIPEFKMHYYKDDIAILSMKIVVGKTKMRTPVFNRKLQYVVKNPRWNVPPSIYRKEYAHKSEAYLRRKGFAYNSEGKLYQKEGRRNALGIVKFLFPNKYNVYMHDTPSKSLFNRTVRAFSHGCIRLEKPLALLKELGYTYSSGKNKWITLKEKIPVYVEYHTVWVDDNGIVQFRNDIYGYEKKLFS